MLFEYGKKFSDQWGGADPEPLKLHWAQRLVDLTGDELKRGVSLLETKDWPPSLPEFRKMCRPPIDPIAAYYEAVNGVTERERGEKGTWSHPAIYWASVIVGAFDLKNLSYSQVKDRWQKALDEQLAKSEWSDIPDPVVALPAPGKTKTDREQAQKMLAQLHASDIGKGKYADQRRWIAKIFERQKRGDSSLPGIAVRFAKEAMGVMPEQR
jgi:hypothetical protein